MSGGFAVAAATPVERLKQARRVVVKIGSALLVDQKTGLLRREWLETLAGEIAAAMADGQEVVLVSSGAIALGRTELGLPRGPLRLEESQAAAAAGQIRLAHAYQEVLAPHGVSVAQVLLTLSDTEQRRRYLNARSTIGTLLKLGALPVINENDTVATEEIRFGDNDRLGARVAQMMGADLLVLLSDIDGLYTADPRQDANATFIETLSEITPEIEAMAGGVGSALSSGGMVTKLAAAHICLGAGCAMVITDGKPAGPLGRLADGARATWFVPDAEPRTARKDWIAGSLKPLGRLTIDDGAVAALGRGKSLLPAGVTRVDGRFARGDAVTVADQTGRELGRGLVAYDDADARRIAGHKTDEIADMLGYRGRAAMIHRDDLVLFR